MNPPPTPMLIRPAQVDDLSAICVIERASFSDPWTQKMFMSEMLFRGYNYAWVLIDTVQDCLVGYCFFWLIEGDEIHITNIAVDPSQRQQGWGRLMFQSLCRYGCEHQVGSLTLEVRESNLSARTFYQRLAFQEVGRRKNYYEQPKEDAILLRYYIPA
jgi:[ribosomal protein S18]-alanine N-acetyltransferase